MGTQRGWLIHGRGEERMVLQLRKTPRELLKLRVETHHEDTMPRKDHRVTMTPDTPTPDQSSTHKRCHLCTCAVHLCTRLTSD